MHPFPPPRIDLYALFILLGAVQGYFLSYFFLTNAEGSNRQNRFLGFLLLGIAIVMTDVWLGYTNYMFHVLWLVDSTEPINLTLAPLSYLYIKTGIRKRFNKKDVWHFLPAAVYFLYLCVLIYPQDLNFKYNANIGSFHPEMAYVDDQRYGADWMFFPKWHITDLTFISLTSYCIGTYVILRDAYAVSGLTLFTRQTSPLNWYRKIFADLFILVIIFVAVRYTFPHDLGDHLISAALALTTYITSMYVFRQSGFFLEHEPEKTVKKYEKSSLSDELRMGTLAKLEQVMASEKPHLDSGFSLPGLAQRLGISVHNLSQILNEELRQTFFDFLAAHRVAEAQRLLASEDQQHIKIEEIAQMVGYNSKSAFNTSFRKITGLTPSEYRRQHTK